MALTPGTRLGPYEVTAQIGVGGMGEVWRATDTTLGREVAIKVLPDAFAQDAERLARFEREAKTLASLNHPGIAAIYGFEKADGARALVMELIEGATLADRIAQGPVPVDEALPIARQIVDALEAAHEQGIVHRDLKPANIKVRDDGTVKVLDFGLAKALDPAQGSGLAQGGLTQSPTITSPAMTQMGMILGTAAYMSPEQAKGRAVDARADVWAFGAVLFEMLSGRRAFDGEDVTDILGAVVRLEPTWETLPPDVPARIRQAIRGCLQKDPKQRIAHIHDVRLALEGAFETAALPRSEVNASASSRWRQPVVVAAAVGALTLALSALAAWSVWPRPRPAEVSRFVHPLQARQQFRNTGRHVLAVSPDGRAFVYNAAGGLYLRRLSEAEAHVIPGTEAALTNPFFSPDGDEVAYFQDSRLFRVALAGGPPVEIASGVTNILGAHWAADGTILFGQPSGIMRVRAVGGTPELVVKAAEGDTLAGPQLLPDGDLVLFTRFIGTKAVEAAVESLSTDVRTRLVAGASDTRYAPTGHLVYLLGDNVFAAPFDAGRLQVGEGVPVLPRVSRSAQGTFAHFAIADNGTLVFSTTVGDGREQAPEQLTWFSPTGQALGTIGQPAVILNFDLAADGRVVIERAQGGGPALWMADANREWPLVPANFRENGFISDPAFSPTGDRVAFASGVAGNAERVRHPVDRIYAVPSDGGVPAPLFGKGDRAIGWLEDWSPDGTRLLVLRGLGTSPVGVVATLGREAESDDVVIEQQAPRLDELQFSPNGQWIAYHADRAAGGLNVYVVPYPPTGQVYKVSDAAGGSQPKWRQDGRGLFYLTPDGTLMSVTIESAPAFRAGRPQALFKTGLTVSPGRDQFAVAGNGQRFLVRMPIKGEDQAPDLVEVVLNWHEELRRLVPTD